MKKVNFGIIGCGLISNNHADAIRQIDNAVLYGCTDVNEKSLLSFSDKYGIKAYQSVEDMLNDDNIDVVSVCTPSGLHARFAVMAANHGKHVVVEKPMALTVEQCNEIIKASEENHIKVEVICQNRFLNTFRQVKKIIEDGKLGKIVSADIYMKFYRSPEYYASSNWKGTWKMDGGGALMNQGIHGIDIMLFMLGDVKSVFGHARTLSRDIEVEDTASAVVEYENGALGIIQGTTSVAPGYPRRVEINGDQGSLTMIEGDITVWDVKGVEKPVNQSESAKSFRDPMNFSIEGHILQLTDMVEVILNDREPFVNQYEGKRAVELITAIYQSSKERKLIELK
ncbi:MAG: Gfo/Idh/MocA family oxidoreductase [Clostridia bacterium]|nr:Gfo/Idh/MocA family oxidoreductase [Clostridia bacterium]